MNPKRSGETKQYPLPLLLGAKGPGRPGWKVTSCGSNEALARHSTDVPWSDRQCRQTGVLLNFRTNWVFSPDEWDPHHIIGIHAALLTHVAGFSGGKKERNNLRHSLGTTEYHVSSSLSLPHHGAASLSGHCCGSALI